LFLTLLLFYLSGLYFFQSLIFLFCLSLKSWKIKYEFSFPLSASVSLLSLFSPSSISLCPFYPSILLPIQPLFLLSLYFPFPISFLSLYSPSLFSLCPCCPSIYSPSPISRFPFSTSILLPLSASVPSVPLFSFPYQPLFLLSLYSPSLISLCPLNVPLFSCPYPPLSL
jgi:hypothetical protein